MSHETKQKKIDEACGILIRKHEVSKYLLDLLILERERIKSADDKSDTKSSVKVLHAVVGALKNLSLSGIVSFLTLYRWSYTR